MTRLLQRKDTHGFFAFPVNDIIAPGYSSIIQKPMDFSTINGKVEDEEYTSTNEYKVSLYRTDFYLPNQHPSTLK